MKLSAIIKSVWEKSMSIIPIKELINSVATTGRNSDVMPLNAKWTIKELSLAVLENVILVPLHLIAIVYSIMTVLFSSVDQKTLIPDREEVKN